MNVLDYLLKSFNIDLEYLDTLDDVHEDFKNKMNDLRSMPLDSVCGDDCKEAIYSATRFVDRIKYAYGEDSSEAGTVIELCVNVCLTFICG